MFHNPTPKYQTARTTNMNLLPHSTLEIIEHLQALETEIRDRIKGKMSELGFKYFELAAQADGVALAIAAITSRPAGRIASVQGAEIPPEDTSIFRSGGQTHEYGPRPRIATARPAKGARNQ